MAFVKWILEVPRRLFLANSIAVKRSVHSCARISETNVSDAVGTRRIIKGWVKALRNMKDNVFIDVSDGSCSEHLQIVIPKSIKPSNLTYGSSVSVEGDIAMGPNGRVELRAETISVVGECVVSDGYPFMPRKKYPQEYIRQYLHMRPRTNGFGSLLRIRDLATVAIGDHLRSRGFVGVHTPVLTSNDCEGAGEVFTVRPASEGLMKSMKKEGVSDDEAYFNTKVFLTVSGQLQLESVVRGLSKVFCFGPTFRAENSKSRLHLSEFYMIEAEIAFARNIEELAQEAELLLKSVTNYVIDKGGSDLRIHGAPEPDWLDKTFHIISYDEAVKILEENIGQLSSPIKYGESLSKDHELFLVQHTNGVPVFIVDFPKESKPFYMKEAPHDPTKAAAMDLLMPIVGELIGGSMREDNYDVLKSKLSSLTPNLDWYLELRKYGNVPSGGFGMGFERYLQTIMGIPNIKDTIPFPRWPHNCKF
ncbi:probable asparagine--tRNA ligase, mitochondrial isoform X1 [Diprion similis]|uniref:probable asparagine--tRNA ligase, mitochondrial isoform X1 n=1 Tax=Diprion similis TaxID=362088 RepID=UPI001EF95EFF|nr:probable asparagine--tRNA ligase, mitochondrial isoform X1 [Diprion similis]